MSISLIVGKPGDGKSYAAVHMCILPALQQGRSLFTNIPINEELARIELSLREDHYIRCIDKEKLEKSDLFDIPGGTLIVLDEVWRYWKKEERKPDTDDEKFFAEHRHKVGRMPGIDGMLSQDIVLITQNTNEIPTWIKGRIASTYKVVKLNAVGADNRFRVDVYRGAQGERPQKDSFISASLGRYSSDVWRYYQSHTLGDTSGGVSAGTLEAGPSAKVSIWQILSFVFIWASPSLPSLSSYTAYTLPAVRFFPVLRAVAIRLKQSPFLQNLSIPLLLLGLFHLLK